ncbi:glycosyltransferase family 4 protein [Candidatus Mycolicibacterium alkanivorans]|uniref:Glycosyltransferase family 4 protein n=1 Tax=Candidatus Mycolicibacterium alkanivorans TaxID=2954114 RepID=A0ABS9YQ96_9MYCO|nr:glycosyltransferase family 4 protein [Candidatus Mycolicibacterium alkanivorans]MCI4673455.1 glycosyltransferase family 4 protein [Candidatus Mycolicibacterium alkanivorans]
MERRLIVEQFDPECPRPSGIDTCIRGLARYCPPNIKLQIAGVDALGNKRLGEWAEYDIGGRSVEFMPVARLDPGNIRKSRPHSGWVAYGLQKYRPAADADVVNTHRLNLAAIVLRLYPRAGLVQYLHGSGIDDLEKGSRSIFRHALFAYRWLERNVIPRAVDTVVFSKAGTDRLTSLYPRVRFSPNWYDPAEFYPSQSEAVVKSRILWPARIEPQKNPELAVDVMSALPEQYTLTVAGSGALDAMMRRRAQASGAAKRIQFIGAIPKSKIGAVMRSHDLLLMTSRFEGYPYAVVEGLASGLPVVTTPGGEPNRLVEHGVNGARVDADSPELFVPAVEVAAKISARAARDSVSRLSAVSLVPEVLTIPRDGKA